MMKWTKFLNKFKDYVEQYKPSDNTILKEYDECIALKKHYKTSFEFDYTALEKEFPICFKNIISSFTILFS